MSIQGMGPSPADSADSVNYTPNDKQLINGLRTLQDGCNSLVNLLSQGADESQVNDAFNKIAEDFTMVEFNEVNGGFNHQVQKVFSQFTQVYGAAVTASTAYSKDPSGSTANSFSQSVVDLDNSANFLIGTIIRYP